MKKFLLSIVVFMTFSCGRNEKPDPIIRDETPESEESIDHITLFLLPGQGLQPIYQILESAKSNNHLLKLRTSGILESNTFFGDNPDEAAFLTSIFIGKTTFRGSLGLDRDSLPSKNLFELAHERGFFTSILTPGYASNPLISSLIGHQLKPSAEATAWEYTSEHVDFVYGFGRKDFERRRDRKNVFNALNLKGFQIYLDSASSSNFKRGKTISVQGWGSGENRRKEFNYILSRLVKRNFKDQKTFTVVFFPPNLDYPPSFEMDCLAAFLEATEHDQGNLTITLSYPSVFDPNLGSNRRSSIGGVSSLLAHGPGSQKVMGLHSSSDFGKIIARMLEEK